MSKKIVIRIFNDGKVTLSTQNIKGEKCTEYLKVIQELVDGQILDSTYTEEYYENDIYIVKESEINVE